MRILLTGAGGPSAISVWKSLRDDHQIFMADMDPKATGLYLVPADQRLVVPRGDSPSFVDHTYEACRSLGIELLICTVDAELAPLAHAQARFEAIGVRLPLSPLPALELCRDKLGLLDKLKGVVPVPDYTVVDADTQNKPHVFPMFAKPRVSAGSRGATVIADAGELRALPQDGSYLLQELLPGDEYSVDVYLKADGAAIAAVPRVRMKTDSGIAVAARTVHDQDVIDAAIRAAQTAGIRYVANVQFKRAADGQANLLEINPRFPGTLPLTAEAGVDLPNLLVAEVSGQSMPTGLLPFRERMVVRYWSEQFFDPQEWRQLCGN
ncbi:MAG: ATP-grasp domain-containing protein [Comamonadaceae bacterium]|nr:ATP-grasp domain-containing protein [Comamonadaceae bacterium]